MPISMEFKAEVSDSPREKCIRPIYLSMFRHVPEIQMSSVAVLLSTPWMLSRFSKVSPLRR